MTLIIFTTLLLLIQGLHAIDEFPDLDHSIRITWESQTQDQIDTRPTYSIDGQVPFFIICGNFSNSEMYVSCDYSYSYPEDDYTTAMSGGSASAKLIAKYSNGISCLSFENQIGNFSSVFEYAKHYPYSLWMEYDCRTTPMNLFIGIFAILALIVVGIVAFIFGRKKGAESLQKDAYMASHGSMIN